MTVWVATWGRRLRRRIAPSPAAYLLWCARRLEQLDLFVDTDGQLRADGHLDDMFFVDDYGSGSLDT